MQKVLLFDADGVLNLPEEFFTQVYAKSRGLDPEPFEDFFKNNWQLIVTGQKDLKESIAENSDLWQWSGTPDELVEIWCKTEDLRNNDMLELIVKFKHAGCPCYLATDQETYRGNYMRDVMFKGLFDGYFISAEMGCTKDNPKFFDFVIGRIQINQPDVKTSEIIFFDDSQSKVDTAIRCGIDGRLFKSIEQVKELLEQAL